MTKPIIAENIRLKPGTAEQVAARVETVETKSCEEFESSPLKVSDEFERFFCRHDMRVPISQMEVGTEH